MKKRTTWQRIVPTVVPLLALVVGVAWAGEKSPDGKTLFRQYCKPCHGPDSAHGEVTPMTLIGAVGAIFQGPIGPLPRPSHGSQGNPKKLLKFLTPELLQKLKQLTMEQAADGEQPMPCG
ncbi:MAG: hypothetical protein NZ869_02665 [Thermoanaerobaculum sp.]|nr:hypothetical protein [Thermoanaerobaculum sp.]MDW7967382.1 hypothetical protein [Thermoanaerobaculum sp.]